MPQLSGPIWVQRFPTSRSTADLTRAFGSAVDNFIGARFPALSRRQPRQKLKRLEKMHLRILQPRSVARLQLPSAPMDYAARRRRAG